MNLKIIFWLEILFFCCDYRSVSSIFRPNECYLKQKKANENNESQLFLHLHSCLFNYLY